jgi:hypothetical protein
VHAWCIVPTVTRDVTAVSRPRGMSASPAPENRPRRLLAGLTLVASLVSLAAFLPRSAGAIPVPGDDPLPPRTTTTRRVTTTAPPTTLPGPRYKVEAVSFKADDESGWDWTGSDEPIWAFHGVSGTETTIDWAQEFGDVDTGESRNFGPRCLVPNCTSGVPGPITVNAVLVESDLFGTGTQEYGRKLGGAVKDVCGDYLNACLAIDKFVGMIADELHGLLGDDFIDFEAIHWPATDLAQLAYVGASGDETIRFSDGDARYTLTVRTTRMA